MLAGVILMSLLLVVVVGLVGVMVGVKVGGDREKYTAFECGFDGKGEGRFYFSLRFFLLTVVFLIFDVEMVLLLPLPIASSHVAMASWVLGGLVFLGVLLVGLYHEWREGALEWN
uniref:NADH-ubiquinone oxidoreductase chain 3 n=1 Tax=Cypridina dentata TaxID=1483471 RepID=A0A4D6TNY2_9CRUS|nr:NADH dehydrogenase subunit 3 [Cypridina dentata]QCG82513.1 NADH dehydrogenase subunit 3 [Cypridina dentata]